MEKIHLQKNQFQKNNMNKNVIKISYNRGFIENFAKLIKAHIIIYHNINVIWHLM